MVEARSFTLAYMNSVHVFASQLPQILANLADFSAVVVVYVSNDVAVKWAVRMGTLSEETHVRADPTFFYCLQNG